VQTGLLFSTAFHCRSDANILPGSKHANEGRHPMQFGIFGSAQAGSSTQGPESGQGFRDYLDYCVEAEALGFRSTFLVEHHFTGWNQVSSTLMLLTCVAMRTTTLRVGTAVIVLPWHNPVLLAEEAATLDLVSNGRLDLGIGKGYRHSEFKGFCIPPEEAEARFEEALALMRRAWTSRERFSHSGRFHRFDDIVVEPPPMQTPHPPLWVAAASEASIRRAAERGFNLILDQYASPEAHGRRIALYRSALEANGGAFDPMRVAVARQLYVAKDRADAEAAKARAAMHTRRTVEVSRTPGAAVEGSHVLSYAGTEGATEEHGLFGTPDEICEKIDALRRAGAQYVLLTVLGGKEQLRRVARDVMPNFVQAGATRSARADEPTHA
jgi:alkanesulfonate monooxygenase SsuD/methylene tetrahydromethanopterin reductase-like flavin-dependent oxidoreductase (luciferase family)